MCYATQTLIFKREHSAVSRPSPCMFSLTYSRRHCTGHLSMRHRRFSSQRQGENFLTVILVFASICSWICKFVCARTRVRDVSPCDARSRRLYTRSAPSATTVEGTSRSAKVLGQSFDYGPNINSFIHYETAIDKFVCNKRFCRKLLDVGYYGDRAIRPHSIHDAHRLPVFLVRALQP